MGVVRRVKELDYCQSGLADLSERLPEARRNKSAP